MSRRPARFTHKPPLTQARLRELLTYDTETGAFTWLPARGWKRGGIVAGYSITEGYRQIKIDGVAYAEHRLAWFYMNGKWPSAHIDHINGNKGDNAWKNLREATHAENLRNRGKTKANKSGFKGVSWHSGTGRWQARIQAGGKDKFLGRFDTPEAAHRAYADACSRLHGAFARPH